MSQFKFNLQRTLPLLAIIGPGIIAGSVDNDAGGIATYSIAGAQFGTALLWVLVLSAFSLVVTQEVGVRLGLVTGKGLAALIRERFGVRWTTFIMIVLLIANLGTIAAEFAGIASALEIVGMSKYISIPVSAVFIFLLVTRGSFKRLEKIFLAASAFYIVYAISAVLANPNWGHAIKDLVVPSFMSGKAYFLTLIALIGTTITPWGQFFIQGYVVDKKLAKEDLKVERADVAIGSLIACLISFFIIVACAATLFTHGVVIHNAADAAVALKPFVGSFATILFGLGLFNASVFGAALVPISTSYVITEAFGLESGLDNKFSQAPEFYGLFAFLLLLGGLFVILPFFPLLTILFVSQAVNAVLLLPIFIFLLILSNDKKILNKYTNGFFVNTVVFVAMIAVALASVIYFASLFMG